MYNAFGIPQRSLILGATSEIGAAVATRLAESGTQEFILAARNTDSLAPLTDELRAAGARAVSATAFDALHYDQHERFINELWAANDHIDFVLVAFGILDDDGAGGSRDPATVAITNYVGAVTVIEAVANQMRAQSFGTIVVLSSVAAERPRADNYLYASSKAGLDHYAQGLGDALAPDVRVMTVRPGFVASKMTTHLDPAPFATTPRAVADDIMAGLAKGSDIVWSPHAVRGVMSGLRHLPRPVYRRVTQLARN
jgi:decaprenylphospho-beta-D-erythro-pentofuranosid-2-ulose 2-reductase